jgi:predicted DNA-binding protein with PD1-like motif
MSQASAIYRSLGGHLLVTMVTAHVEVCVLVSVMDILSYPTKISFKIVILKILISSV